MQADLHPHLWQDRLLVVFAPSPEDPRLVRQERAIRAETRGMRERELVRIVVLPRATEPKGYDPTALRRRFRVRAGDFRVLLIGKDGGVKRSSAVPVSLRDVFAQIDTMPMRREEIRRKGS